MVTPPTPDVVKIVRFTDFNPTQFYLDPTTNQITAFATGVGTVPSGSAVQFLAPDGTVIFTGTIEG